MLFGQYLILVKALRPEDVLAALDDQDLRVERFGRIAAKRGYLSAAQLLEILDDQFVHKQKVGETAIRLGYMSEDQVRRVLIEQKEQRRPIGTLLVERGALNEQQLRQHLSQYFKLGAGESPVVPPTTALAATQLEGRGPSGSRTVP